MFGIVADLLTIALTLCLPLYLTTKALRTPQTPLTPWIIYWSIYSLFLTLESFFYFILYWVPFYSWMRLAFCLYLLLPPSSPGATYIYTQHLAPLLQQYEPQLDAFIGELHEQARTLGLDYIKQAIEWVRVNVLGFPPQRASPPQTPSRPPYAQRSSSASYVPNLLARFSSPSSSTNIGASSAAPRDGGVGDIYNYLASWLVTGSAASEPGNRSGSRTPKTSPPGAFAPSAPLPNALVPPHLSPADRRQFIATQRDRLRSLIQAFDREAASLAVPSPSGDRSHSEPRHERRDRDRTPDHYREGEALGEREYSVGSGRSGFGKSRSEAEFDTIDPEEAVGPGAAAWGQWFWGNRGTQESGRPEERRAWKDEREGREDVDRGRTSGFQMGG